MEDNLTNDLLQILSVKWDIKGVPEHTVYWQIPDDVKDYIMQELCIYINDRDHKILGMNIEIFKEKLLDKIKTTELYTIHTADGSGDKQITAVPLSFIYDRLQKNKYLDLSK